MKRLNKYLPTVTICSTLFFSTLYIPSISHAATKQLITQPGNSETIKTFQQKLRNHLDKLDEKITIEHQTKNSNVNEVLDTLIQAYNEELEKDEYLKYNIEHTNFSIQRLSGKYTLTLNIHYRETKEQSHYVKKQAKLIIDSIITPNMNDHEKVKIIHDYVVANIAYDTSLHAYTAYEALVNRSVVCQGYALLTYQLLKEAGIPSHIISGTGNDEPHAWNLVKIENKWYHLDTTFNDPIPDQTNLVTYSYFNLSDELISKNHQWDSTSYPKANTNYYDELMNKIKLNDDKLYNYQKILQDTNLIFLSSEFSAENYEQLIQKIQSAFTSRPMKLTLRYRKTVDNTMEDIKKALNEVSWPKGAQQVSYQAIPYDIQTDSSLLTILFTY